MTTPDPQYPPPLPYTDRACVHGYNPQACTLCELARLARALRVQLHYERKQPAEPKEGYWVRPSVPPSDDNEFESRTVRGWDYGYAPTREEAKARGFGSKPGHMSLGHFLSFARGTYPGMDMTLEEVARVRDEWRAQFRPAGTKPRLRDLAGTPLRDHAARMTCACGVTYLDHHVLRETPTEIRFECPKVPAIQRGDMVARDADGNVHAVNSDMCVCGRSRADRLLVRGGCHVWVGCNPAGRAGIKPGT